MELGDYLIKVIEEMRKANKHMKRPPNKWVLHLNDEGKVESSTLEYGDE